MEEIRERVERGERALITTLTKKMAEDLADYLKELGVKVQYLHSEVDTLERVAILRDLRLGVYDVLVGINLLREGLDLPEVTLVAILDADKEGFLRSAWSLIQMIGRAARNTGGEVIMYADTSPSRCAWPSTRRIGRRAQAAYNAEHGIEPTTIVKDIRDLNDRLRQVAEGTVVYTNERGRRPRARPHAGRAAHRPDGGRDALGGQAARVRAGGRDPRRDPAGPIAGPRAGPVDHRGAGSRAGRTGGWCGRRRGRGGLGVGRRAGSAATRRRAERAAASAGPTFEVTSVAVLPADEEPLDTVDGVPGEDGGDASGGAIAAELFPGIRDEHDDDGGWQARWLERPTWDVSVTPNIRRRTGQRPGRRGPRRGY